MGEKHLMMTRSMASNTLVSALVEAGITGLDFEEFEETGN